MLFSARNLRYYFSQHRTRGCKITHMIGIPLIVLSGFTIFGSKRLAGQLFFWGWVLQFVGHYVFEHNKPVLLEVRSPATLVSALLLAGHQWSRLVRGKRIVTS